MAQRDLGGNKIQEQPSPERQALLAQREITLQLAKAVAKIINRAPTRYSRNAEASLTVVEDSRTVAIRELITKAGTTMPATLEPPKPRKGHQFARDADRRTANGQRCDQGAFLGEGGETYLYRSSYVGVGNQAKIAAHTLTVLMSDPFVDTLRWDNADPRAELEGTEEDQVSRAKILETELQDELMALTKD